MAVKKKRKLTAAQLAALRRNLAKARKSPKFKAAARRNLIKARQSPKFRAALLKNLVKARAALAAARKAHGPSSKQIEAAKRNLPKARAALAAKRASMPKKSTTTHTGPSRKIKVPKMQVTRARKVSVSKLAGVSSARHLRFRHRKGFTISTLKHRRTKFASRSSFNKHFTGFKRRKGF